jgi:pyridoxal phosphate enzyme (YggS family)
LVRLLDYNNCMNTLATQIKQNLQLVELNIQRAALAVKRQPEKIRLIVVSKSQSLETIQAAYSAGVRCFGENYPQEADTKINELSHLVGVEWHMIGHLQSRKVPIIANRFQMIHSIDSLNLALKLNQILGEHDKVMPALLEVNVGGEDSKYGWVARNESDWAGLLADFGQIIHLPHLSIQGLMTMPPLFEDPESSRPFFTNLRRLRDYLASQLSSDNWAELSMGTSADYEVAIEEGATMIRVGQAILGARPMRQKENPGENR